MYHSHDMTYSFMVFNDHNYPNMVRLFDELGVAGENTDMSFR